MSTQVQTSPRADAPVDEILCMRGITKVFPGVRALDNVNLGVKRGEVHAICGENGAGKSTLMKVLSGVYPAGSYEGVIELDGTPQFFKGIKESEKAGIAIIHQELALIPELSVTENVFLGNEPTRFGIINWDEATRRTRALLDRVGLVVDPAIPIKELGIGQQQLIEIAKALNKDVRILILDEPTAALNETDSQHLLGIIDELRRDGITSIIISHKLEEIRQIADSVTIIRDGQTIETLDVHADGVDENRIIRGMVGRQLDQRFPDHEPKIGDVLFEVRDWTVLDPRRPDTLLTDHASFHVRAGEIVGFAGLMGAGRTELARSLFGRSYGNYLSGEMLKNGKPINPKNVTAAIRDGLAYVTEDRKTLGLNLLDDIKTTDTSANLRAISKHSVVDENKEYEVAERYRETLRLKTPSVDVGVNTLSGGNQQKVVLSKWMFTEPDILILDEPTRGIDVGAKYEIYRIINAMADQGKAVILISSELPELLGMSDRIYTINKGRITGCVSREEADQENLMRLMTSNRRLASKQGLE